MGNDDNGNSQLLKYVTPLFIFLGVLRLYIYYHFFNINIIQFLTLGEIITSFLDIIILLAIYSLLGAVALIIAYRFLMRKLQERSTDSQVKFTVVKTSPIGVWFYFILIFIHILYLVILLIKRSFDFYIIVSLILIVLFFIIIPVVLLSYYWKRNKQVDSDRIINAFDSIANVNIIILSLLFLTLVALISTLIEVSNVRTDKKFKGVELKLSNDVKVISDLNNYFIGKTENYTFFYHQKENITDVIPNTEIKEFKFKMNSSSP